MGDCDNNNKKYKTKMSRSEMEIFSLETGGSRFSRDFLTRFMGSSGSSREKEEELLLLDGDDDEEEEIELNLGLSLGGRFGVDKSKLIRSSSIATCLPIVRDDNDFSFTNNLGSSNSNSGLIRTSSVPVETEEEWRKRKELQTLRRMVAKRRRSEKQRNLNLKVENEGEDEKKENLDREQYLAAANRFSSSVAPPFGQAAAAAVVGGEMAKGKGSFLRGNLGQLLSQRSVGSSSSELESSKALQGSSSCGDLSPGSNLSSQKGKEQEMEDPSKQADIAKTRGKETKANALEDMPCVFTKGVGPNGRRVEGILYKYGKGEEVRIMCVCHGSFLSPAEFIKHAGGTDVTHPLKHIVVNPNATPFL